MTYSELRPVARIFHVENSKFVVEKLQKLVWLTLDVTKAEKLFAYFKSTKSVKSVKKSVRFIPIG